jgi:hypothetical protein
MDFFNFRVLSYFNADPLEFAVIFTSNATGALKLLGESFANGGDEFDWSIMRGKEFRTDLKCLTGNNFAKRPYKSPP